MEVAMRTVIADHRYPLPFIHGLIGHIGNLRDYSRCGFTIVDIGDPVNFRKHYVIYDHSPLLHRFYGSRIRATVKLGDALVLLMLQASAVLAGLSASFQPGQEA